MLLFQLANTIIKRISYRISKFNQNNTLSLLQLLVAMFVKIFRFYSIK